MRNDPSKRRCDPGLLLGCSYLQNPEKPCATRDLGV